MGAKTVDTSSTSNNSTTPDSNAYAAYLATLQKGEAAASTPYQPYSGSLTAGINATQVGGENATQNAANTITAVQDPIAQNIGAGTAGAQTYAGLASQGLGTAQGYAGEVNNLAPGALGAAAGNAGTIGNLAGTYQPYYNNAGAETGAGASMLTPGNFGSTVANYMSPYTQDVVNATQNQFNNQNSQQSQSLLSQGIASGNAFGGDREGVAQGILAGQQQTAEAPVIAGIEQAGYTQASNEANTAAQTALQAGAQYGALGTGAQNAALSSPEAEAGILNQGYATAGNLGTNAASIANAGYSTANNSMAGMLQGTQVSNQGIALDQADAQLGLGAGAQQFGMGTTQQQTQQAADTAQYGQFQNQIAFPYEQTGWLGGLAATVGPPMGGTSTGSGTATVPAGNIGSTIAGGATALTGLAGLLKRGGRVDGFASGGAPGAGGAPQNFPGGNATWLIPPPPSAHSAFNVPAYQQPNTAGMASSIANSDSQAMSSLGTAAKGLTNSSLGDSISDFTQDLGGAKRGGRIGNFATGGTPGAGGSVATPAPPATPAAPVAPTYTSTTDPATGIVSTFMAPGSGGMNIPPPPQLGAGQYAFSGTFGNVPAVENAFSEAQGAYYAQYPGAPGDPNPNDTPAAAMSSVSSGAPGAAGALTSGSAGSLGSAPAISKPNIVAPPIPLTTMQVAAGAKRGGSIGHYDDGGGIYGDLSGVPAALAAADSSAGAGNWPDYGTSIAAATGLPPDNSAMAAQYANQMPNPSTMMQNAVDNAPALAVAQQDLSAANPGSFASAPVSANDNGMPFPQQATGTYGPVAGPSDYSSYAGGAGNIGAPGLSTIQSGGTPESLQADAFNQPGVTRYADGTVTGLAPSYIPPTPTGNLASTPASTSYPGAGGASMYTGPARLASTATQPVGSVGATPAASANGSDFLTALKTFESGGRNIPNTHEGTTSGQAQGYDQITTGTWKDFAPKAGVDLSQYPNALSAPQAVQDAVAKTIPMGRWAPETLAYLKGQGYSVDPTKTLGANIAANGASSGTTLADQPGSLASPAAPSSPQDIAKVAATAPSTGGLLDGLGIHLSKDASLALMSAGFGMMASRSPFFGQGIGEGAQAGIKTYVGLQQQDRQNALAQAQIANLKAETGLKSTQAQQAGQLLKTRQAALAAAYPDVFGATGSVQDKATALGKSIAANAKPIAAPEVVPTNLPAPSPSNPVEMPAAQPSALPPDQDPAALRAKGAEFQRRSVLMGMAGDPDSAARLQAAAAQAYEQADKTPTQTAAVEGAKVATEKNFETQNAAKTTAAAEAKEGQQTIAQANAMLDVMFDPKTGKPVINAGPLGPQISGMAALLNQAGLSPEAVQAFTGTDPSKAQDLEKLRTVLGSEVARQALQGSPVRVSEFNRFLATTPSDELLPQAFKWIVNNTIVPKAQQSVGAYKAVEEADPGKDNIQGKLFDYSQDHPWYKPAAAQPQQAAPTAPAAPPASMAQQAQTAMDAWDKSGQPPDVIAAAKAKILARLHAGST